MVQGAPEVEARWALDVVRVEIIACRALSAAKLRGFFFEFSKERALV